MKKTLDMDEFKKFCIGKSEIRYSSSYGRSYKSDTAIIVIEFSKIIVAPEMRTIRLLNDKASLKFEYVAELQLIKSEFGDTEVRIACENLRTGRKESHYIFLPPQ